MKFASMLFALAILTIASQGQNAGKPTPINASVGDVTDNRTTGSFNSECKLELKFIGDAVADASGVRGVRLKKAVDDLGRDLIEGNDSDSSSSSISNQKSTVLKTDLKLRNPSRNAMTIKLLEGDVELFSPNSTNGGIVVVKDVLKKPAEFLTNATLQKFKIDLMYLTKETFEAKKKELEAKKNEAAGKIGEAFGELFKGMFNGLMSSESPHSVRLYMKDPEKRVMAIELQDANGKALKRQGGWSSAEMRQIDLDGAPPPDSQLRIHLATPESIQTFPFKIENVPLP